MIFTSAQVRAIRQGQMTAVLVAVSESAGVGRVRVLRRRAVPEMAEAPAPSGSADEVLAFIEARLDLSEAVKVITDVTADGESIAVLLTILAVEDLALEALTLANARACGCKTVAECRAAWSAEHPHSDQARLVWFGLGDLRDVPLLIGRGWPDYTSDPSRAMVSEPEPVSPGEQTRQASDAGQRYARFQADQARELARDSASERLAAVMRGRPARSDP